MVNVNQIESDKLSGYHTHNSFPFYGEFTSLEEYLEYYCWAQNNSVQIFILGNGSNTLFKNKEVKSLVLLNRLPATLEVTDETYIEASSSVQVMQVLRYCEERNLESFYYLASVPATVGGAVAMNAGLGGGGTIFNFVESVTFVEDGNVKTLPAKEIHYSHRTTPFAGVHDKLILSVRFRFNRATDSIKGSIRTRAQWSMNYQDRRLPNCGSVFKICDRSLFRWLSFIPPAGIYIPGFRAQYSRLTSNWIINRNRSSWAIMALIRMAIIVHRILRKRIELEIIVVD